MITYTSIGFKVKYFHSQCSLVFMTGLCFLFHMLAYSHVVPMVCVLTGRGVMVLVPVVAIGAPWAGWDRDPITLGPGKREMGRVGPR